MEQRLWAIPIVCAAVGGALWLVWLARRVKAYGVLAAAWLVFAALEAAIEARVLCDEECNIRIDLVTLGPIMILWTLFTIVKHGTGEPPDAG